MIGSDEVATAAGNGRVEIHGLIALTTTDRRVRLAGAIGFASANGREVSSGAIRFSTANGGTIYRCGDSIARSLLQDIRAAGTCRDRTVHPDHAGDDQQAPDDDHHSTTHTTPRIFDSHAPRSPPQLHSHDVRWVTCSEDKRPGRATE